MSILIADQEALKTVIVGDDDDYLGHLNPKFETRSTKWFGELTTLSPVERQILIIKIPMTETKDRYVSF